MTIKKKIEGLILVNYRLGNSVFTQKRFVAQR